MDQQLKKEDEIKENLPVYFLGLCSKYSEPEIGFASNGDSFHRQDIIGLRTITAESVFPFSSENYYFVFLIDNYLLNDLVGKKMKVVFSNPNEDIGTIEMTGFESIGGGTKFPTRHTLVASRIPGVFKRPGEYGIYLDDSLVGRFLISYIKALPLTEERLQAIKSDPLSAKYLKFELRCTKCNDFISIGAGIDKKSFSDNTVWYEDLSDEFKCKCGETLMPLNYLRESAHQLLGYKESPFSNDESIERNYTHSKLEEIYRGLKKLVEDENTVEEKIQKYIEDNPFVLNLFNPKLLGFKANATTKHKTDFVIYNHRNELLLIEIERANLALFTKDNSQHSELTNAINQVEDWLLESSRNRYGFINDLQIKGVSIDDVTAIKGIIIAGRTKEKYADQLEKLYARTGYQFFTYDDLLKHLMETIEKVKNL